MTHLVKSIIQNVAAIGRVYEKVVEATGENFNVFQILNLSTNETRTHSALLAEFLDPKGSHGQGSIFLELFLQKMNILDFDFNNAKVTKEKYAGSIDDNYLEGGRLDILLQKPGHGGETLT